MVGWNAAPSCSFGLEGRTSCGWFSELSRNVFTQLWIGVWSRVQSIICHLLCYSSQYSCFILNSKLWDCMGLWYNPCHYQWESEISNLKASIFTSWHSSMERLNETSTKVMVLWAALEMRMVTGHSLLDWWTGEKRTSGWGASTYNVHRKGVVQWSPLVRSTDVRSFRMYGQFLNGPNQNQLY